MVIAGAEETTTSVVDYDMLLIHGVGGIGKTTIAKYVYDKLYDKFGSSSFVSDISNNLSWGDYSDGIVCLQKQLISDLVGMEGGIDVPNVDVGISMIKDVFNIRKVLLVLDDVEHPNQLDMLLGTQKYFRPGSKIIITSRNKDLLEGYKIAYKLHEVEPLKKDESLELFNSIAFGQKNYDAVNQEYKHLVEKMVESCGGVPRSLSVLASSLIGRDSAACKMIFRQIISSSADDVQTRLLKIAYDLLEEKEKAIFLDIACFIVGMDKDYVATLLDGCGLCAEIGIRNLIDRSLLKVNEDNKLVMHRVIQDMAREIVRKESPPEPGKRSRLWHCEDPLHVFLSNKTGTKTIEGLPLKFHPSKDEISSSSSSSSSPSSFVTSETNRFSSMKNLRLLTLHSVGLIKDFPKNLCWSSPCGLYTHLAADFSKKNVVLVGEDGIDDDAVKTFVNSVCNVLLEKGYPTFKYGQDIESEDALKQIIQNSKCCMIIFSKSFMKSKCNLDELVKIANHFSTSPHRILTVYFNLDKSDVRNQSGSLREAFAAYENEIDHEDLENIRAALMQIADHSPGFKFPNGSESQEDLIKYIHSEVVRMAKRRDLKHPPKPIGNDRRAKSLQSWIDPKYPPKPIGIDRRAKPVQFWIDN